jgi:hypothetical protein
MDPMRWRRHDEIEICGAVEGLFKVEGFSHGFRASVTINDQNTNNLDDSVEIAHNSRQKQAYMRDHDQD